MLDHERSGKDRGYLTGLLEKESNMRISLNMSICGILEYDKSLREPWQISDNKRF